MKAFGHGYSIQLESTHILSNLHSQDKYPRNCWNSCFANFSVLILSLASMLFISVIILISIIGPPIWDSNGSFATLNFLEQLCELFIFCLVGKIINMHLTLLLWGGVLNSSKHVPQFFLAVQSCCLIVELKSDCT